MRPIMPAGTAAHPATTSACASSRSVQQPLWEAGICPVRTPR